MIETPVGIAVLTESGSKVTVTQPEHGTATYVGGTLTYVPNPGYVGADTIVFVETLADGSTIARRFVVNVRGNSVTRDLAFTGGDSLALTGFAFLCLTLGALLVFAKRYATRAE